ncbi:MULTISPECIES: hypothetical protein [unclassified Butyrivibrio]|uniref:hypothetical protein n=1 Tax=unclassified Butyrivibrio TaxID=2639466 RepID=UPI0003FA59AE|nr:MULTISPECIES: hypothetical protein [unclassified Butyrivibrio]SDB22244.1 hypothetical protein SAMN02910263_01070 [Butyrivibrio sp. INlla16]
MLDKFIIIGATTLTLSGILGAILVISWPDNQEIKIKELKLKWKIPLLIEALLVVATLVLAILSIIFWFKGGRTL